MYFNLDIYWCTPAISCRIMKYINGQVIIVVKHTLTVILSRNFKWLEWSKCPSSAALETCSSGGLGICGKHMCSCSIQIPALLSSDWTIQYCIHHEFQMRYSTKRLLWITFSQLNKFSKKDTLKWVTGMRQGERHLQGWNASGSESRRKGDVWGRKRGRGEV